MFTSPLSLHVSNRLTIGMAKMNGKHTNKGQGFDRNPQNINRKGQPPKLLRAINNELIEQGHERVTNGQVVEAYELLLGLPEAKIKAYSKDKNAPMLLRIVAKQLIGKFGNYMVESMLDRSHGKSKASVDLTTKGQSLNTPAANLSALTDEELSQLETLRKKMDGASS